MKIQLLTAENYRTGAWSGGTTTELFIYPENADYAARQFLFRISSATVDLEESDFTPLAGVERYITPLAGHFTLEHPDGTKVEMGPLSAPYRFSGEIPTHCIGTVTDFNLMLKGVEGIMELHRGAAPIRPGFNSFYAPQDGIFTLNGTAYPVKKGQMLIIFAEEEAGLQLQGSLALGCFVRI